jgi:hypothetical protein
MTANVARKRQSPTTSRDTKRGSVLLLESTKRELARQILEAHERCSHAVQSGDKDYLRGMHQVARIDGEPLLSSATLNANFQRHREWFKVGREIDPARIRPTLKQIDSPQEEQLWALAKACWSMPYTKGYGRRLRFLVIDEEHGGLIGVLGLQSPPADLECRDALYDYPKDRKLNLVNQTLDAYTIGALPPYSFLLGGKLCAGLLATDRVRESYWSRYAARRTLMGRKIIQQPLVAITTTSAFGRSSIYNRLRYDDRTLARPIGYTKGYGLLHLEHLYPRMCDLLRSAGQLTPNGYGNGPKVRWQNVTKALMLLGLPLEMLAHGVRREVFLFELVDDLVSGMSGGSFGAPKALGVEDFSTYWRSRWALPRAERFPHWKDIDARALIHQKVAEWSELAASRRL